VLAVTHPSADGGTDNHTMTSTLNSWDWSLASSAYCGGTFYGLHPRSWTVYENPVPDTTVIVKQVSPFIPHSYSEASLPCTAFIIEVINTHPSVGIETSIMFCFENGYRDEQEMQRMHVNSYFHIDAQSKSKISREYQDKRSHEVSNVNKNKDISMTATGVSIEGICMAQQQQQQQQQQQAKQMQRRGRFNSYSIASTCNSIDQLFSLFSESTTDHHIPQATSSATTTTSESSLPSEHDGNNDGNLMSANAVMSTSLSYCESFITSYSTVNKGQGLHLIDRLNSFLFGFNMPSTDDHDHDLDHHTNHGRYGHSAHKLWESFKLNGTISNIDDDDDDDDDDNDTDTGDNIKVDQLNNSFGGNVYHHGDDEGDSDSSKGDEEDASLNQDSSSRSKPSHRIYSGGEGASSSITIGSAVCLKKWIQPILLSTTTFHNGQTKPIMKNDDETSCRNETSTANSAVFPFALAWDNPYVAFGRTSSTTSSSNSNNQQNVDISSSSSCGGSCGGSSGSTSRSSSSGGDSGDGDYGMNEVPRYYTRFFGCSGLSSSKIASWALMKCSDWDRQIDKWQQEIIHINPSFNNDNCNSSTKRKNKDKNRTAIIDHNERSVNDVSCARDRSDDDDPIKSGNINIPCSSSSSSSSGSSSSGSSSSSFYNSQLFNELYYLVDGGSIWTDTQRGEIVQNML
jgi:hypothetical protein